MVPAALVVLDELPLTANGKVDRKALPAPELQAYASQQYEAPSGEIEQRLASIWCELLQLERVGRHDNFFELGGDSILATRLSAQTHLALGIGLPLRPIFECQTLQRLAEYVEAAMWIGRRAAGSSPALLEERENGFL
jgi:acyl carrier protein